ncbi:MAG: sodium:proton antiporter [Ruminococcaceae bacterium]|nr:sodium:proton antiporter [Oscillospiraceae bacterium]
MGILLSVSVALLAGLLMTRAFKPLKLPSVTAYLIAGVLIGPYCIGQLGIEGFGFSSHEAVEALGLVSKVALGFIAFSIGNEFRVNELKQTGKQALVIGIVQALVAALLVDLALFGVHLMMPDKLSVSQAITLGAIATATAPAATLMVVRQYKAKGPLTNLLLPIVALDDAVGLIVFAVSFGIAKSMMVGQPDFIAIIIQPLLEIICSLALGAVMGWILTQLEKMFNSNTNRLNMTITFVFLTVALSMLEIPVGELHITFSPLLVCMMMGTVFCNICPLSHDLMEKSDKWTSPLFALFFVISGAELELNVFADWAIVVIGLVYIVSRCLGKYYGTFISAKATKCSTEIQKYLGITLFPQAGVALGMCAIVAAEPAFGAAGNLVRNITLFAVLIYEVFGPVMTREALRRAGDIKPMSDEVKNRRQHKLNESKKLKQAR